MGSVCPMTLGQTSAEVKRILCNQIEPTLSHAGGGDMRARIVPSVLTKLTVVDYLGRMRFFCNNKFQKMKSVRLFVLLEAFPANNLMQS